jgi:hypothetical protein
MNDSTLDDLEELLGHEPSKHRYRRGNFRHPTHCVYGHEFTVENTKIAKQADGKPMRQCKECNRVRSRECKREKKRRADAASSSDPVRGS